ncbi:efflux RND transporter periplasmic adaptor subunit [Aquabacterium sp.]|uniref:efflux RND transporter periplasmic adaptor subunit n=1 Tax=Aquabacterium sp. TaxID=1872578 RepID=UPI003783AA02
MKKTTLFALAGGGVLVVALLAWAFAPRPLEVEAASVTRGRFEASIEEDGKTRLRDRYVVSAPLAGVLSRITLREGDTVAADAVVGSLRPVLSPMLDDRSRREQQARVEAAQAMVQRATARTEAARVALQQARNELQRSEQLARQGFVSPTQLDTQRLAAQGAQREVEAAASDRHVAEHDLEQARAALGIVRGGEPAAVRNFELRAPIAGQVLRVLQPSEATVAPGTALIELGDIRALEVVAELLTTDALQARPGSRVLIDRWGGDGVLEGRVRRVEPGAFTKVSALGVEEQRVRVIIDITSPAERWQALGDGYRVSVRVITLALDNVLKVPVSAVFPQPGGGMAVYRLEGGRAHLQPVQLGARNGNEAWLKQGPAAGSQVIVYPPAALRDGLRVTLRSV